MKYCEKCGSILPDGAERCPICKGEYEEIKPCKICGSYVHDIDEEYCNDCKSKVKKRFSDFVDSSFTKEERQLLNELYDDKKI